MGDGYETVIGVEVHVELATKTTIFCGSSTACGAAPNTNLCPVGTGQPGARPVLSAFTEEVAKRQLQNVAVGQTGCIGICQYEPVVEVFMPGQEKVTYVKMTAEKAARVVNDHLVNGNVVTEYTIGANAK